MKSPTLFVAALLLFSASSVLAIDSRIPAETIRGRVQIVTVGGIETPARQAVQIGERIFSVGGDQKLVDSLHALVGQSVEVEGVVKDLVYVGGEGCSLLTVFAVRRVEEAAAGDRLDPELARMLAEGDRKSYRISVQLRDDATSREHGRSVFLAFVEQLHAAGEFVEVQQGRPDEMISLLASGQVVQEIAARDDVVRVSLAE